MSFSYQKEVGLENKPAIQGDRANNQPVIYAPENFIVKGGTAVEVKVGNFAWRDTTDPTQVVGGGTGAPLGFIERVQNFPNYDISTEGTLVVPGGAEVNVAIQGDFYVAADASCSAGATVYANTSNGAATMTSTSGASVEDTGFKVWDGGTQGDMVIITKR